MDESTVIILGGVQVPALEGLIWPAVILGYMVIVVAPAARARTGPRTRVQRRSWTRTTPSSGRIASAQQRGLVIMYGFDALFLGVIMLAIILFVVGLCALQVLVVALRAIVALIVLMMIVGLAIVVVALVASMVVAIFATTMLTVAWFTPTRCRNMSRVLFLWLLLVLGNLLKNASRLVGCLTLLKESHHLERVGRHHLV
jgi:hypothetical protein